MSKTINLLASAAAIFILLAVAFMYERYTASNDASTVNIAGQQRMLTVRIVEEVLFDHLIQRTNDHNHAVAPTVKKLVDKIYTNMDQLRPEITDYKTVKIFEVTVKAFEGFLPLLSKIDHLDLQELHNAGKQMVHQFDLLVSAIEIEKADNHTSGVLAGVSFWLLSMISIISLGFLAYKALTKIINQSNQDYRQLARRAEEAMDIALAASKTKSEFLANMSHELRTPLNAIIGFSEIMLNGLGGELSDKHKEYSNDIFNSGHHLLKLINDILDLSKVEAGKTEVHPENVSICSIFKDCVGLIYERAQEKQIIIDVKTSCDGLFVYADPIRVKQIVLNLLANSVKFTSEKGKINISCMVGDKTIITIEDNGIGMNEEGVKAALTKFGQANTGLAREYEGTGLGLPLSVELAKLMGGTVDVASELGIGTTITVTLPKGKDESVQTS